MALSVETLKRSDIDNKFSVPKEWVDEYWPNIGNKCRLPIRVRHEISDTQEKWYEFELSTRAEGPRKTEFKRKGWQKFINDNKLKEGDAVRFGIREGENHFTIRIERKYI